ncbi:MAG: hypothetical protein R6U86_04290 [Bacteroidales bacterium]
MTIPLKDRTAAFIQTGQLLHRLADCLNGFQEPPSGSPAALGFLQAARESTLQNPWFTKEHIARAVKAIAGMLDAGRMEEWLMEYSLRDAHETHSGKNILLVMAGNIPLVGFHDFLCVLISGNRAMIKSSSLDRHLPKALAEIVTEFEPGFRDRITFPEGPVRGYDAVIATGSNNSARYFDYYFGKVPHIIRKNRNSMAILSGEESQNEITLLGDDVFSYFGLGCRNVSLLWLPKAYDMNTLGKGWMRYRGVVENQKYANNYDFQKAVSLVNKEPHHDTGFCLFRENHSLSPPLSVIHYQKYRCDDEAFRFATSHKNELQCLVSRRSPRELAFIHVPFGMTQQPSLWDYADGVDTLQFLSRIS